MEKEVSTTVKVRFSDCDPIGHLNNVKYLEYHSKQRTLESATLLLTYKDLSKEEYNYILELLKNWGDSLALRIQILLLKLTFYADLVSKIKWWKCQMKVTIKNSFLVLYNRQE